MAAQIIDPLHTKAWDALITSHAQSSFFHRASWARVIHTTYGFTPFYLIENRNDNLETLLPVMEAASAITGNKGIMLPFTDFCPIICRHNDLMQSPPFKQLLALGQKRRWKYIEFRGGQHFFGRLPAVATYYTHTLELERKSDLRLTFRNSTRRNIRRAEASGIKVAFLHTKAAVRHYYRLHCRTRQTHGVPPQPWVFFENLWRHVIKSNQGVVAIAWYRGQPIAGAVFLYAGHEVIFKYGASDQNFQRLRPNNLIMWAAMQHFGNGGYRQFSFGRTEENNIGLLQFKRGWRPIECKLPYYRYQIKDGRFLPPGNRYLHTLKPVLQRLPVPVLRSIGALVYRHIG